MFIFGSGKVEKQWQMSEGRMLVVRWEYSHLFWCRVAHNIHWYVISDKRSEDREINYDEVMKLFPVNTPRISHWQKYGGYYAILIIIVIGFIAYNSSDTNPI